MITKLSIDMKKYSFFAVVMFLLTLFMSSQYIQSTLLTLLRTKCGDWLSEMHSFSLNQPQLVDVEKELIVTKYSRMQTYRLENQGGFELLYCDGFHFPRGLVVTLTRDGHSCEITGIPTEAQAVVNAYVLASNHRGRSLAKVPIVVNAIVLQE